MKAFELSSYLAQVHRLRELAGKALSQYAFQVQSFRFIDHGENTTFQVTRPDGANMLLRIHRRGYHTEAAINEELKFLETLSRQTTVRVPKPIRSKDGKLVVSACSPAVGAERYCSLLSWIDGRLLRKTVNHARMRDVGKLLANIHIGLRDVKAIHRCYWDAEGLLGPKAKLGSIDSLRGISSRDQRILIEGRERVLRTLINFQRAFPHKQGVIHADPHFGNLIVNSNGIAAIDFDDCGFGFRVYDLAVSLNSAVEDFTAAGKSKSRELKEALLEGYAARATWDKHDETILPHLVSARKLAMLGWLNTRWDNPGLRKYLPHAIAHAVRHVRSEC